MTTIAIGMNYAMTLGLLKSLGSAGYRTGFITYNQTCYKVLSNSRYAADTRLIKFCFEELFDALETIRGDDNKALIVPANDYVCLMLDKHYEQLKTHYYFPVAGSGYGNIERFMSKTEQKRLAREIGLPVAEGKEYATDPEGIRTATAECSFPCFVKPVVSAITNGSKDVIGVCRNEEELMQTMAFTRKRNGSAVVVEEYLEVERELSVYGVSIKGSVIMPAVVAAKEFGCGASKGIMAEGTVHPIEYLGDLAAPLARFAAEFGLDGLFCIDLLVSNGKVFFSEVNLRSGASLYAVTMAGVNLPGLLADYSLAGKTDRNTVIEREACFVNEKELLSSWRGGHIGNRAFVQALLHNDIHFLRDEEDPEPWKAYRKLLMRGIVAKSLKGPQE